jgi:hypothetical protein
MLLRRTARQGVWVEAAARARQRLADENARKAYAVITEIRASDPTISHAGIAVELTKRVATPRGGKLWHPTGVRRVILRCAGRDVYGRMTAATRRADEFCLRLRPLLEKLQVAAMIRTEATLAAELNRRGIQAPRGGKWFPASAGLLRKRIAVLAGHTTAAPPRTGMRTQVRPNIVALRRAAEMRAAQVAPVVTEIYTSGIVTLDGIAAELYQRGIHARRGGKWYRATIRRLLVRVPRQARYTGHRRAAMVNFLRRLTPILAGLIDEGFDTRGKLWSELNRRGELTITGAQWSTDSLRNLLRHLREVSDRLRVDAPGSPSDKLIKVVLETPGPSNSARADELNKLGLRSARKNRWTKDLVSDKRRRLRLTPLSRAAAEEQRRRIKAVFDGMARHGRKSAAAFAEEANRRELRSPTGRRWTAAMVRAHLFYRGRKVPKQPPKWSAEDVAEMVDWRNAGWTISGIAFSFRTTVDTIKYQLRKARTAKFT